MDATNVCLHRVVGTVSPALRAAIEWQWKRDEGDLACALIDRLVQPGTVAIDAGAAWGFFSFRFARLAGAEGHVFAFEPNPAWTRALGRLRKHRNVTVETVALSDRSGVGTLRVPGVAKGSREWVASLEETAFLDEFGTSASVPVPLRRLDDVLGDRLNPSFLKADVEGHELPLLQGAEESIRRSGPTLLLEIEQRHQRRDIGETFGYLGELGYRGFILKGKELRPLAEFDVEGDQLARHEGDSERVNEFLFVSTEKTAPLPELGPRRRS